MGAVDQEFSEFVAATSTRLVRVATLLTGDSHLAQDLVQTSLTKTYLNWARASGDPFRYVRRVMINQRTDWWRRRKARGEVLTPTTIETAGSDDFTDRHATRDTLLRALRMLTQRERTVLVLRFFEDMTEVQVADELGIAVGTVKSCASRALAKLRITPELAAARREATAIPFQRSESVRTLTGPARTLAGPPRTLTEPARLAENLGGVL